MAPNGDIEWVNAGFRRLFGYRLGEWVKHKSRNIIGPNTDSKIKIAFQKCIQNKQAITYELKVLSKEHETVYIQANLVPILDDDNDKIIKIIAVDSNISNLKMAENKITLQKEQLQLQNRHIAVQNENIKGSIRYALTLQEAILPTYKDMAKFYKIMILYKAKDIVSGDFYWFHHFEDSKQSFCAVIDCTGHGVPGAFMSIISHNLLNEIIIQDNIRSPNKILEELNTRLTKFLKQDQTENTDGMDIALVKLVKDTTNKKINIIFAGSKRPAVIYRAKTKEIQVYKGSRKSIGGLLGRSEKLQFTNMKIVLNEKDVLYLYSDGYIDQNNINRKKFGSSHFFNVLSQIGEQNLSEQKEVLLRILKEHKFNTEQRDDITILGIKY